MAAARVYDFLNIISHHPVAPHPCPRPEGEGAAEARGIEALSQTNGFIRAQQLRLLCKSSPIVFGAPITAVVAVFVLWPYIDHALLLGWTAGVGVWAAATLWLSRRFEAAEPGEEAIEPWSRGVILSALCSGMLWGCFSLAFYSDSSIEARGFVLFVAAAMTAGGSIRYGLYLPACRIYLMTCTLPIAAASFWHGGRESLAMGGMILAYDALVMVAARAASRSVASMISLQLRNAALVDDLRGAKDSAEGARETAEEASRVKSRFLANMSHELRTPLNAIIGFSELMQSHLLGAGDVERFREYAADINMSGRHLLDLVNDILDLSKLEAGNVELRESAIDLHGLVWSCAHLMRPQADRKKVKLALELPADLPRLFADALRIKQVVINLLSNAVKFTDAGGSIRLTAEPAASGEMRITVRDSGIGMAPNDIPVAFLPFRQIDNKDSRRYEGSGLGLPLAKSFIEQHGGSLTLESAVGAGTTATILLPRERVLPTRETARESA